MKRIRQLLALLLAMIMLVSTLAACGGQQNATPDESAVELAVNATAVQYAKSGKYTTTITSDKVDLSGVTADNIEVCYTEPYSALTEEEQAALATDDEAAQQAAIEAATVHMKADSVTKNGSGWDIAFTDDTAADYATSNYTINFTDLEESALVEVEFPEIKLEPDLAFVTPADDVIKLTLMLSGSEFDGEVTASDISLENAFTAMEVESVSAAGQNLTVQLKGELERNVAGAYQCGTVSVSPAVIKDGYAYVPADVPVKLESAFFDATTMKYADGKITGEFKIYGVADPAELTEDNVKIDGVTVEAVEQTDDNTVKLTLSADDADSVNAFADLVSNSELTLGDYTGTVSLSQASFYPVYDYVEKDGDNLKLTVKLYAADGAFTDDLSADSVSFSDGFEDAKAESLTLDSDTLATLILTIPSNGMTEEDMDVEGTVTLAAGSLVNAWGDKTSAESSYTRQYNAETLGRGLWSSIKNAFSKVGNAIKDGVSTVGNFLGNGVKKIVEWGKTGVDYVKQGVGYVTDYLGLGDLSDLLGGYLGGGSSGNKKLDEILSGQTKLVNCSQAILSELGAVRGDLSYLKTDLADVKSTVHTVLDNQYTIMLQLDKIAVDMKMGQNDTYRQDLEDLETYSSRVSETLQLGAIYFALNEAFEDGVISKMPDSVSLEDYNDYIQYLPDTASMSDKELANYNDRMIDYIDNRSKNSTDVDFRSFNTNYDKMLTALTNVANKLKRTDSTNPIARYDEICAMTYNFDSQCFEFRASTRLTALMLMSNAMTLVTSCEKAMNHPSAPTFKSIDDSVSAAIAQILVTPIGHAPEDIKANKSIDTSTDTSTNTDPTYYPYSYVLKKKVCIMDFTEFGWSMRYKWGFTEWWKGALINSDSYNNSRDWTDNELRVFFTRMSGKTLQQELASAGIEIKNPLAVSHECEDRGYFLRFTGNRLKPTATSADAVYYENERYNHPNSYVVPSLQNPFCVFELY